MAHIFLVLLEIYGCRAGEEPAFTFEQKLYAFIEYTLDEYKNLVKYISSLQFTGTDLVPSIVGGCKKQSYQIANKTDSRKIAEFLSKDGQLLLPFLELTILMITPPLTLACNLY